MPDSPEPSDDRSESPITSGSPFAAGTVNLAQTEIPPPRLSIIHLFGWMTCIAIYAAVRRLVWQDMLNDADQTFWTTVGFYAIAQGAALGGLIIWITRRIRSIKFPRHPGELLLILLGFGVVYSLAVDLIAYALEPLEYLDLPIGWRDLPASTWIYYLLFAFVYLVAARRVDVRRWRMFFYTEAATYGLQIIAPCLGIAPWSDWLYVVMMTPAAVVIIVAITDWRRGMDYPWTHWLGPAIMTWYAVGNMSQFVWYRFVEQVAG